VDFYDFLYDRDASDKNYSYDFEITTTDDTIAKKQEKD
jgi:hypothetical protein